MKSKNKAGIHYIILVIAITLCSTDLLAFQEKFKVQGSIRLRAESKVDYNFKDSNQDYVLSQFRINTNWKPTDKVSLFVEAQDARIFGESASGAPAINEKAVPNIYKDQLDIHRAFALVNVSINEIPLQIKLGRQKFNLAQKRLVSSLEWVNTARVWDGVRISYGNKEGRSAEIFVSQIVPVSPDEFNNHNPTTKRYFNSSFSGIYITDKKLIPKITTEYYYLYREENKVDDAVSTFGVRADYKQNDVDMNGEFAYQIGSFGGLDHSAYMLHLGVGYKTSIWSTPKISTAYNFGSGDKNSNDDKHQTFDNLYPLNHAYYGYMDLFGLQNLHNFELIGAGKVSKKLSYRIGWQMFYLVNEDSDSWYNAGLGKLRTPSQNLTSAHVGNEIDVTVTYKLMQK